MHAFDLNDRAHAFYMQVLELRCAAVAECRRSAGARDRLAEDMEFFDFGTIFFLVAAVVIFFQLRNVLGRRTGNERPPFDPYTAARTAQGRAGEDRKRRFAAAQARRRRAADDTYAAIDAFAKPGSDLNKGLRAIKDADPSFDPKTFVDGAKMAYEMIVMAYADGDRKTLKNLLSREVYRRLRRGDRRPRGAVGEDPVLLRRHRQGRHRLGRDEGRRGACHAAHRQRADLGDPQQGRRGDRRRSGDGGRGQGRLDLRPRHALAATRTGSSSRPKRKTERRWRSAMPEPMPVPLSPLFHPVAFADLPGWADDDHLAGLRGVPALGLPCPDQTLSHRRARRRLRQLCRGLCGCTRNIADGQRRGARASSSGISCRRSCSPGEAASRLRHRLLRAGGRGLAGQDGQIHRAAAVAAGRSGRHRRHQPAGRHGSLSRLRAADASRAWSNISTGRRSSRARWTAAGPGDRLAGRARSMPSSSMCRARRGSNMTDGSTTRVTYAAKSGQRFTGTGRVLADLGEIPLEQVTMQSIRAWFASQPGSRRRDPAGRTAPTSSSARRRSTIPALGPIAAAKVPLTPGRSMAVDRLLHTFGTPFLYRRADADGFRRRSRSAG